MDHLWKRKAGLCFSVLLAALLFLSACGASAGPATLDPRLAATVAVIKTQYVMPVTGNTAQPLSTPAAGQPAGPVPLIIVQDQDTSGGQVILHTVISDGPGWAVIHATDKNGSVGEVIGYAPVNSGANKNVQVTIDKQKATPVLFAELHTDAGKTGTFEYPGPDQPVIHYGQAILAAFNSSASAVSLLDQLNGTATAIGPLANISSSGSVSAGPTDSPSTPTPAAAAATAAATTPAITTTPTSFPTPAATSTLPPAVKVNSQPLKNGQVTIAEVVSPGVGWIVVYASANGQPGPVLGYAQVKDGANTNIPVSLLPLSTSHTLIAILHTDAGKPGVFEFPGPDAPVTRGQQLFWAQFNLTS